MEKEVLRTIAKNTSRKPSYQVVLTGVGSRLETHFSPPLSFDPGCNYELALVSLESFNSIPNITKENNKLKVFFNGKWLQIVIPIGCYELADINDEIQRQITTYGGNKGFVTLTPNLNTFKCIMTLASSISVDMRGTDSIAQTLGFEKNIYSEKRNISENTVNIMTVNSILVHSNLIGSSYLNGSQQPIIFAFYPAALPGEKIIVRPNVLIYLPVMLDFIRDIVAWLTDQDNRPIDLQGEKLTIKLHIRAC